MSIYTDHKTKAQCVFGLRCVNASNLICLVFLVIIIVAQAQPLLASNCQRDNLEVALDARLEVSSNPEPVALCVGQILEIKTNEPIGSVINGQPQVIASNIATASKVLITALEQGESTLLLLSRDRKREAKFNISTLSNQPSIEDGENDTDPSVSIIVYRGTEPKQIFCEDSCIDN